MLILIAALFGILESGFTRCNKICSVAGSTKLITELFNLMTSERWSLN